MEAPFWPVVKYIITSADGCEQTILDKSNFLKDMLLFEFLYRHRKKATKRHFLYQNHSENTKMEFPILYPVINFSYICHLYIKLQN